MFRVVRDYPNFSLILPGTSRESSRSLLGDTAVPVAFGLGYVRYTNTSAIAITNIVRLEINRNQIHLIIRGNRFGQSSTSIGLHCVV